MSDGKMTEEPLSREEAKALKALEKQTKKDAAFEKKKAVLKAKREKRVLDDYNKERKAQGLEPVSELDGEALSFFAERWALEEMRLDEKHAKKKDEGKAFDNELEQYRYDAENARLAAYVSKEERKGERVAPEGAFLSCVKMNKIYSNKVQAVFDFSLDVKEGEFIVLVGPSGCGKSTMLRMIAGLEDLTSGSLYINGVFANDLEPKRRRVAMVFQSYALYPHMSVYKNMSFGLEGSKEYVEEENTYRKLTSQEIDERIQKAAEALQIKEYLDRKPTQLSGGQCQRVALGRAYVRNAKIFLLDEPLSNLDAKLRVQMRSELVKLHESLKNTMVYVTHDQTEAMTMADRIVVMKKGVIQQVGTPTEVYNEPHNVFVATFIGSPVMNIFEAKIEDGAISLGERRIPLSAEMERKILSSIERFIIERQEEAEALREKLSTPKLGRRIKQHYEERISALEEDAKRLEEAKKSMRLDVFFGIRPEDIGEEASFYGPIKAKISAAELLGAEYYLHFDYLGIDAVAKVPANRIYVSGEEIDLRLNLAKIHLFDKYSEEAFF